MNVWELWTLLEADFQREYGLDVSSEAVLESITWRRFCALIDGLSPKSAMAAHMRAKAHEKERPPVVSDPTAARRIAERWGRG